MLKYAVALCLIVAIGTSISTIDMRSSSEWGRPRLVIIASARSVRSTLRGSLKALPKRSISEQNSSGEFAKCPLRSGNGLRQATCWFDSTMMGRSKNPHWRRPNWNWQKPSWSV